MEHLDPETSPEDLPLDTPDSPLNKQLQWVASTNEPTNGSPMFKEVVNPTFDPVAAQAAAQLGAAQETPEGAAEADEE